MEAIEKAIDADAEKTANLQGTTCVAVGLGVALSSILGGLMVRQAGFPAASATLAAAGVLATLFFAACVREPPLRRPRAGAPETVTRGD